MSIETKMIASDLKNAGFRVEEVKGYNSIRVSLTRKMNAFSHQVEFALNQAGYEPGMYRIIDCMSSGVFVNAIAP